MHAKTCVDYGFHSATRHLWFLIGNSHSSTERSPAIDMRRGPGICVTGQAHFVSPAFGIRWASLQERSGTQRTELRRATTTHPRSPTHR